MSLTLHPFFESTSLLSKSGDVLPFSSAVSQEEELILLYFSASWCPPCRGFTPRLVSFYNDQRAKGKRFQIIFISCDRSQGEFDAYYAKMPWLALPHDNQATRTALSSELGISGIPCVVILNQHLEVIGKNGVELVNSQRGISQFPSSWLPKSIYDSMSHGFAASAVDDHNARKGRDALQAFHITNPSTGRVYRTIGDLKQLDTFALYFSASWCPPCRGFTPVLSSIYQRLQQQENPNQRNTEIILVSWDKTEEEAQQYFSKMPWASFDFRLDQEVMKQLATRCNVRGIPTLVTVNAKTGTVINYEARAAALSDPTGSSYPWVSNNKSNGPGVGIAGVVRCCILAILCVFVLSRFL